MAFLHAVLAVLLTAIVILFLSINAALRAVRGHTGSKPGRSIRILVFIMVTLMAIMVITITLIFARITVSHGLEDWNTPIDDVFHGIKNTPVESDLPSDTKGVIVIYYRFGCGDCETIWPELKSATQDRDVYFISTRSETGKQLLEDYPVTEVPTGIYITHDGLFYAEKLYYRDANKNVVFDQDALQRLFDFQTNNY